jgi:hypothetical protein
VWHIVGAAEFDSNNHIASPLGSSNFTLASDLLWQNDNGALALWQSNGSNGDPFVPGTFNPRDLPNPGPGWHVASVDDFDGNTAADILFQHDQGNLAIWEFQSAFPGVGNMGRHGMWWAWETPRKTGLTKMLRVKILFFRMTTAPSRSGNCRSSGIR